MCHLQPKVVVALVMRARGGISALLDLPLKKLGCLQHCDNQKAPFGAPQQINACALLFVPCWFCREQDSNKAQGPEAAKHPAATCHMHRHRRGALEPSTYAQSGLGTLISIVPF